MHPVLVSTVFVINLGSWGLVFSIPAKRQGHLFSLTEKPTTTSQLIRAGKRRHLVSRQCIHKKRMPLVQGTCKIRMFWSLGILHLRPPWRLSIYVLTPSGHEAPSCPGPQGMTITRVKSCTMTMFQTMKTKQIDIPTFLFATWMGCRRNISAIRDIYIYIYICTCALPWSNTILVPNSSAPC